MSNDPKDTIVNYSKLCKPKTSPNFFTDNGLVPIPAEVFESTNETMKYQLSIDDKLIAEGMVPVEVIITKKTNSENILKKVNISLDMLIEDPLIK